MNCTGDMHISHTNHLGNSLDQLIDDAEELLTALAANTSPEVQELRDRVDKAIGETRNAIAGKTWGGLQLRNVVNTLDDYVHDFPWLAIGAGALVTAVIAFAAGSSLNSRDTAAEES